MRPIRNALHVIAATAIFLANGPQAGLGPVGPGSAVAWGGIVHLRL